VPPSPLPLLDSGAQPEREAREENEKDTAGERGGSFSLLPRLSLERDKKREYLCGGYLSR